MRAFAARVVSSRGTQRAGRIVLPLCKCCLPPILALKFRLFRCLFHCLCRPPLSRLRLLDVLARTDRRAVDEGGSRDAEHRLQVAHDFGAQLRLYGGLFVLVVRCLVCSLFAPHVCPHWVSRLTDRSSRSLAAFHTVDRRRGGLAGRSERRPRRRFASSAAVCSPFPFVENQSERQAQKHQRRREQDALLLELDRDGCRLWRSVDDDDDVVKALSEEACAQRDGKWKDQKRPAFVGGDVPPNRASFASASSLDSPRETASEEPSHACAGGVRTPEDAERGDEAAEARGVPVSPLSPSLLPFSVFPAAREGGRVRTVEPWRIPRPGDTGERKGEEEAKEEDATDEWRLGTVWGRARAGTGEG